jgi:hypothetical protein
MFRDPIPLQYSAVADETAAPPFMPTPEELARQSPDALPDNCGDKERHAL